MDNTQAKDDVGYALPENDDPWAIGEPLNRRFRGYRAKPLQRSVRRRKRQGVHSCVS